MNIRELNEAVGDILRKSKTIKGNPWTETDEGIFTFELLGLNIEYQLYKHEEKDAESGEVVKVKYEIEPTEAGRKVIERELEAKIAEEFKKQAKDFYGVEVARIGGNTMIGVPNLAEFIK